jgi:hypothetical protein
MQLDFLGGIDKLQNNLLHDLGMVARLIDSK